MIRNILTRRFYGIKICSSMLRKCGENMRVGLAQLNIIWEDKMSNLSHCEKILKIAQEKKIDMVLFPEMTLTGFSMETDKTKDNIDTIGQVNNLSKKYNLDIGMGYVKKEDSLAENHYALINEDEVLFDYVKLHPFSFAKEDKYFKGGDKLVSAQFKEFTLSCGICYDLRFPEIFQVMSKKAEFIMVPANWPGRRREHFITLLKARAIENQCYIAGINCVGEIGGLNYLGDTCLYNPNGDLVLPIEEIYTSSLCEDEKILIYEIENNIEEIRSGFPVKKDRIEELYMHLYKS